MIAIRGLALAAVAGALAIAFAPRAAAESGHVSFTREERHDATRTALDNDLGFSRDIQRPRKTLRVPRPRSVLYTTPNPPNIERLSTRTIA